MSKTDIPPWNKALLRFGISAFSCSHMKIFWSGAFLQIYFAVHAKRAKSTASCSNRVRVMLKKSLFIAVLLLSFPLFSYAGIVGTVAPAFSLEDLNGKAVTLEQFKGKVVFVAFWAPWCGPCKEELPELGKLYNKYRNDGFEVIGISLDGSRSDVSKFIQKINIEFLILMDKKDAAGNAYRVSSLPVGFLIGKDGIIQRKHMGFGVEFITVYEREIQELLKQ